MVDPYKYHDIETERHAMKDPYVSRGEESEEEDYGEELPCHHTFDDEENLFSDRDSYYDDEEVRGFHHQFQQEFDH